ncbi:hypothetical protein [Streptomyces acidicola]|uniref:hypothetical protein n=1 Tax=Streptomyces acidicola TaxID=2596892 RepID=UPI0037FD040A
MPPQHDRTLPPTSESPHLGVTATHAVPPAGLLDIATAATCFGVLLGGLRGRGRPGR